MKPDELRRLLPAVFQAAATDGSPLDALVQLMAELHARTEEHLATLHEHLDPRRAPEAFVTFLARWVDVDPVLALGPERLRVLVALAPELARWRGTARGLVALLEAATGQTGFVVDDAVRDESGATRPFHLRVTAPASLRQEQTTLEAIIRREKPAYVTVEDIVFARG